MNPSFSSMRTNRLLGSAIRPTALSAPMALAQTLGLPGLGGFGHSSSFHPSSLSPLSTCTILAAWGENHEERNLSAPCLSLSLSGGQSFGLPRYRTHPHPQPPPPGSGPVNVLVSASTPLPPAHLRRSSCQGVARRPGPIFFLSTSPPPLSSQPVPLQHPGVPPLWRRRACLVPPSRPWR